MPPEEASLDRLLVSESIAIIDELWSKVPMPRHGPWLADPQVCPPTPPPPPPPLLLTSRTIMLCPLHGRIILRTSRRASWRGESHVTRQTLHVTPHTSPSHFSLSSRYGSSSSPFLLPSPNPSLADVYARHVTSSFRTHIHHTRSHTPRTTARL
jgi:hypothetical protein